MTAVKHKPNLFVPGAGKSGTSSLHDYLNQHPQISMSTIKEPHFFCHTDYNQHWKSYLDLFDQNNAYRYRGESSTGYMGFPYVIERIKAHSHNPKFIFILRNPIDRIYSHYNWLKSEGFETNSFRRAIRNDQNQTPVFGNMAGIGYKYYYQGGCYGKWLRHYYRVFDKERIHIITTESLAQDRAAVMKRCFRFLGLDNHPVLTTRRFNQTRISINPHLYTLFRYYSILNIPVLGAFYHRFCPQIMKHHIQKGRHWLAALHKQRRGRAYPPMSAADRKWLRAKYQTDVDLLKQITGESLHQWKDFQ